MGKQDRFEHLLAPLQITEKLRLKNRMVKAPQSTWFFEEDFSAGDRVIDFYEGLAAGGVGMIVVSAVAWTPLNPGGQYGALYDDRYIPGMRRLTQRVHQHDCPVICQFHHGGPSAPADSDGGPPVGASALAAEELPYPPSIAVPPRALTVEEIAADKEKFLRAAERAKAAGFDGVEVHGAHGYYFESFLSKVWNRRQDAYGSQSIENRARYMVEVVRALKERLGEAYPVGVRINAQEWLAEDAMTIEDAVEIARLLEAAGADYISVSGYGFGSLPFRYLPDYFPYPEPEEAMKPYMADFQGQGLLVPGTAAIKRAVGVPVIAVGRMDEEIGEAVLREGKADLIAFGRYLWADPEFPKKVAQGRPEDIMRCTRCATCEDPPTGRPRRCRVNPAMGKERELAIRKAEKPKKVLIVGAGPAGMEAARVAALRGHKVAVYEKSPQIGGYLPLAAMLKGTDVEDVLPIVAHLGVQMRKLGIELHLGVEVTPELIAKERPDAVVLAVGGSYELPDIPGIGRAIVAGVGKLSAQVKLPLRVFGPKLLHRLTYLHLPAGKRVVIIGGQIEGVQGAVFMKKRGREVTILESGDTIGGGIPPRYMDRIRPWFEQKGVQVLTGVKFEEITDRGVLITTAEGHTYLKEADTVMVLVSQRPNSILLAQIKNQVPELYRIGSANGAKVGSLIVDALRDGREVGCKI